MDAIQWINDLPVGTGILIVVGGGILFALLGLLIVNYYFTPGQLVVNNIIGGFKYAFLSSVYAGHIGLLLFGVYQKYDDVRSDIIVEVNALTTLDRVTAAFPRDTREQLRKELRDYARAVATIEWPQMQLRRLGFESSPTLDDLYYTYLAIEPQTEKEISAFFPWFFGSPNVTAPLIMSTLVATLTMSVFLVILKLSYPFGGDYGILP